MRSRPVFLLLSAALLAVPLRAWPGSRTVKGGGAGAQAARRGRTVFNSNCAHCHGEDAAADDSYYNLPQLLSDKNDAFFFHTVANGIASKGMPAWRGILNRRQMADMLAFIRSIEKEQGIGGN